MLWHPISPISGLFVGHLVQSNNKEIIKATDYRPFQGESTGDGHRLFPNKTNNAKRVPIPRRYNAVLIIWDLDATRHTEMYHNDVAGWSRRIKYWKLNCLWKKTCQSSQQKKTSNAGIVGLLCVHDDVIKWKHFPRYWPFVRGILRLPENSPHKGQWRGVLMFSLVCAWINGWVNNREAGNLRRHRVHYAVTVMWATTVRHALISTRIQPMVYRYNSVYSPAKQI